MALCSSAQLVHSQGTSWDLHARQSGPGIELSWKGSRERSDGSMIRPYFELQRSEDLRHWTPFGERLQMAEGTPSPGELTAVVVPATDRAFYRLLAVEPNTVGLATGGDDVFGYASAFDLELERIGPITAEEFATAFRNSAEYSPGINWDPTTGQFWDLFNTDPEVYNQGLIAGVDDIRLTDFRLNSEELAVFSEKGFVVSERLDSYSFADLFYKLWKDDLPVFISTDSILQAWHRTYDMMVEEVEETYLFESMDRMLAGMAAQVPKSWAEAGGGELQESILDADYFLAVARALLRGHEEGVVTMLGQKDRVEATLSAVNREQLDQFDLFGSCRTVDFSQFKVRGHYENSARLGRYFQCLMWLGRIDLRIAGGPFEDCPGVVHMAAPREMAGAVVLWQLLQNAGEFETWLNMARTIQAFVGWTDSMTFSQLGQLLVASKIDALTDLPDLAAMEKLQDALLAGDIGAQNIRSDYFVAPLGSEKLKLPRSFTVFGQKFVPDSWAFSKVVFDDILWSESGVTNYVCRRVPSALDVAFSVFGNNQAVPEILARILDPNPTASGDPVAPYRDGKPYQHNLAAVRNVLDLQAPGAWEENIYMSWLDTLRTLSSPTTIGNYPQVMRTRAWAMKTLNTQMASWTHLRHDTILYTKQSYTSGGECSYPAGYVEPRPTFWRRLRQMTLRAHDLIAGLKYGGNFTFPLLEWGSWGGRVVVGETNVPLSEIKNRQLKHLQQFGDTVAKLGEISRKELEQECLDGSEIDFLRDLIEEDGWLPWGGSSSVRSYTGWYPRLFYRKLSEPHDAVFHTIRGADAFDAVVADVHTDVPSEGFPCVSPGHVLHEGVGRVNLLMIAVENGGKRMVLAGPVLSHYEFSLTGPPRRMSDAEWQNNLNQQRQRRDNPGLVPTHAPEWTRAYLVPNRQ